MVYQLALTYTPHKSEHIQRRRYSVHAFCKPGRQGGIYINVNKTQPNLASFQEGNEKLSHFPLLSNSTPPIMFLKKNYKFEMFFWHNNIQLL